MYNHTYTPDLKLPISAIPLQGGPFLNVSVWVSVDCLLISASTGSVSFECLCLLPLEANMSEFTWVHFTDLLMWLQDCWLDCFDKSDVDTDLNFCCLVGCYSGTWLHLWSSCADVTAPTFILSTVVTLRVFTHVRFEDELLFIRFCGGLLSSCRRVTLLLWTKLFLRGTTASTLCLVDLVTLILVPRCLEVWR